MTRGSAVLGSLALVVGGVGCGRVSTPMYRGIIKTTDNRVGVSCAVDVSTGDSPGTILKKHPGSWNTITSEKTMTPGHIEGTIGAISGEVDVPFRLSVNCDGYKPLVREGTWHISSAQTQTFDLGDVVVVAR